MKTPKLFFSVCVILIIACLVWVIFGSHWQSRYPTDRVADVAGRPAPGLAGQPSPPPTTGSAGAPSRAGASVPGTTAVAPSAPWVASNGALPGDQQPTLRDDPAGPPPYKVKRVILSREQQLDGQGKFLRTQLVETDMKYPHLRVEEEIFKGGHAGDEFVLKRTAEVASHVIVEPLPGQAAAFEEWAKQNNIGVSRRGPASPIYLVPVSMTNLDDLPNALEMLRKAGAIVSAADPDFVVQPLLVSNDPRFVSLWGMNNIGQTGGRADADMDVPEAWDMAPPSGGTPVAVGVIDTGIDYNHPDLSPNIRINTGEIDGNGIDDDHNGYVDDRRGWDFANNDNNPMDDHFHGTHVAGTIGAAGNNGQGIVGVAWNVKLIPLKFMAPNGGVTSDAIEAIDYATANGARLTNNSWGGGGYSQSLQNAIQRAQNAGVLFVAAAGNSSLNNDKQPSYPASYPNDIIISVAATDHNDALASFSNFGTTSVDVAAPGVGILSTFPITGTASMAEANLPSNYASISGTSMASPHVAGLAALLWSHLPALTASEVKNRIVSRGDILQVLLSKVQSGRRVNALSTVSSAGAPPAALQFAAVASAFTGGNADTILNPGETVELTPELLNMGGVNATAVSVEVVPQTTGLSITGSATRSLTDIAPLGRGRPATPLKLSVSPAMDNNTRVTVQITARWAGGQQAVQSWSAVVVRALPRGEAELTWAPGEPVADPVRERVYLMDKTNLRILAVDTTTGRVSAWAGLAGSPEIAPPVENGSLRTGMLAVSHDGNTLWAALPGAKKVQAFNLPGLTPAATFDVGFSPVSLAQSANGRLFVTSTDYWGPIRELHPGTGALVRTFDKGGTNGSYYMHSLLRLSSDGQRLFAGETGLWVAGGPGYIYEYDVSSTGAPPQVGKHPFWEIYMKDFAADSARQRIYSVNGGIYAVQVTETGSGGAFGEEWPFASAYGAALALPPGSSVVHGASGDLYDGEIARFDADSGEVIDRAIVGTDGRYLPSRALAVSPAGTQSYVKAQWTGNTSQGVNGYRYFFGIVGRTAVDLSNLPPPTPSPAGLVMNSVDFSDPDANRDGIAGPGETICLLPRFRNAGGSPATGVVVTCSTTTPGVSVQGPASLSLGDIPGYGDGTPATGFRLAIGAGVADGTVVDVTLVVTYNGNQTGTTTWRFAVRTVIPNTVTSTAFGALGQVIADHTRNLVYLQDRQNHRILAIDTSLGVAVSSCPLEGPAKIGTAPPILGGMALSVDGSMLYVAIKQAKIIQAIRLPQMQTAATWQYSFEPGSLATDAKGRLYVSANGKPLQQIDGTSGVVLGSFGTSSNGLLSASADGVLLFSNKTNSVNVDRFDTTLSGTPALVGTTPVASSGSSVTGYAWDNTRQRFIGYGSALKVAPLSGPMVDWPAGSYGVSAVQMGSGDSQVWSAGGSYYNGIVRVIDAATGTAIREFSTNVGPNFEMMKGALAVTPNGRAVYVLQNWVGSYNSSADGYTYKVGIIGSGIADLDLPLAGKSFALKSTTFLDPLPAPNNNNGYPNPGETVQLIPTIKNQSLSTASGVSVKLVSTSANATVVTAGAVNAGVLAPYATFTPGTAFKLSINSSAVDGEDILVKFRVSRTGAADEDLDYHLTVFKPETVTTANLSFQIGEIIADPARNLVYLVDKTNARLLAFNTDTNTIAAAVPLAGATGAGFMDFSPDNSKLYIALTGARKIQVFRLPELTQADIVDVPFDIHSIVLGADGFLYASSTEYWGALRKVDPLTGQVAATFNDGSSIYQGSIVRSTSDHKHLFMIETGLSGVGRVPEWDLMGESPILVDSHSFDLANTKDVKVDETLRRIYLATGGVYGIGVTEMDSGLAGIVWSNNARYPYGIGVTFLPNDRFVYGLTPTTITRFSRADGRKLAEYDVNPSSSDLGDRCVAITPNGRILFIRKPSSGNHIIGTVGGPAISTALPAVAPASYAGANVSIQSDNSTSFSASVLNGGTVGSLSHAWRIVAGPGATVFSSSTELQTDASFSRPGRYLVEMSSTGTAGSQSSDIVVVDVAAAPPEVSISASKDVGSLYGRTSGEFTVTRSGGDFAQPLVVNFAVSGTATAGVDYQPLGSSVTIPAGENSARVPVALKASSVASPLTVTSTITPNAVYKAGSSRDATVLLLDGSFNSWKELHFAGDPATASDPTGDIDSDGRINLLEYALGSDPKNAESGAPVTTDVENGPSGAVLTLTYTIPPGSTASYTVETTSSLAGANWQSDAANVVEVSRTTNADGSVTVKASRVQPVSATTQAFIRLKVR